MERRWSRRKRVEREVLLRYEGVGLLRCETRDISFEGVCIDTGGFVVPSDTELTLSFSSGDLVDDVSLRGKVVRVHTRGVGVFFVDYHEGAYQFLLGVLK